MFRSKGRSWKTLLLTALVVVLTMSVLAGCGKKTDNNVVATYDGGEITQKEFDLEQRMVLALQPTMAQFVEMDDFRQYLVKQAIAYKYWENNADDKMKEEGKKKADEQYKAMKDANGADNVKQMLDAQKITEKEFQNYMTRIYTVMETQLKGITEDDVKKEFEASKEDYITASVRHILISLKDAEGKERSKEDALKLANEVKAKLDKGEDFATLAKQYSEDPGSKDDGGLYADTPVNQWVPQFKEAAMTLPLNKISDPVETDYGYHIIRVESRTEKTFADLTDAEKDTLKMSIASQKLDEFMSGDLEKNIIKKITLPKVEKKAENTDKGANSGNAGTEGNADKSGNSGNSSTSGANSEKNSK
ncbi:peptidylprolyl isomerase [Paenibacillus sp. D2_2]|uniref:peptidylprolyl isomerase n=1 Tax=Paenibacillus sp. D2_2 TaxID=3073092 RepID=UPI0028163BCA|nr:peptidylprolyl isomerase [Paenibacillus sp. D2_2]WMT41062.1 peptidylprolyl isomerase [Paenibacillus sp. D2_2]